MRLKRTQYAIAVVVVTTALAADRAAVAGLPLQSRPAPSLARTLAARLTTNLQRSIPAVRIQPAICADQVAAPRQTIDDAAPGVRSEISPFQFRLPPPAL